MSSSHDEDEEFEERRDDLDPVKLQAKYNFNLDEWRSDNTSSGYKGVYFRKITPRVRARVAVALPTPAIPIDGLMPQTSTRGDGRLGPQEGAQGCWVIITPHRRQRWCLHTPSISSS